MSNYILMVFEGEKTEKIIFDSLKQYFLNENLNQIIYGFHCSEIYSLYHKLKNDEDLELFPLLKENLQDKNIELQNIERDEVSEIYLFFDYDGHASSADYEKLNSMMELFDNETENGKLYISYPMVEGLRHLKDGVDFQDTVAISAKVYKDISKDCDTCFLNFNNYTQENWNMLILEHCSKANFITNNIFEFPKNIIEQINILSKQKEKYIDVDNKVAVLSAFPLMLLDYYGVVNLKETS